MVRDDDVRVLGVEALTKTVERFLAVDPPILGSPHLRKLALNSSV